MLKFGNCAELDKADDTAMEVVRILNASIATNKAKIAAEQSKARHSSTYYYVLTTT
jgi:hypothetical protein